MLFKGHSERLSSANLNQSVSDALINVSKQKLLHVQKKFSSLDTDNSGRITSEELSQVLLNNQIFILGKTLTTLVKRFEAEGGGVLHDALARYLLGNNGHSTDFVIVGTCSDTLKLYLLVDKDKIMV